MYVCRMSLDATAFDMWTFYYTLYLK